MSDETADSLKVDEELEKEFQKALEHELTDEDIERARLLIDIDTASRHRALFGGHARRPPQLGHGRR